MIRLDDKWCIEADAYNYVLYKEGKVYIDKSSSNNKKIIPKQEATYHPTLAQAVERYAKIREANLIVAKDYTLGEALAAIKELTQEITKLRTEIEKAVES